LVKPTAEEKNKRIQDKIARARAEMILRVEDNQLVHMISPNPMEIWLTLQCIYQAAGFATSLSLCRKFLTAKKSDHQTMQAWIGQIQGLAFCMKHAKIAVTDQDKILAITMGLPPSFNNVIINFDSMSPETLTLDFVIARLLNEEVRQITTAPSLKEND
jgi:gag-polypeptide of LTR copia-type